MYTPADFGGDPTGRNDSTAAVQQAIAAAYAISAPGKFIGNSTNHAGATVHLGGGEYLISKPLYLSGGGGGVRVCCGALRASSTFPTDAYLLSLDGGEDTTFEDLQFDSVQRGGGIHLSNALRVHISRCYLYVHFEVAGSGSVLRCGNNRCTIAVLGYY